MARDEIMMDMLWICGGKECMEFVYGISQLLHYTNYTVREVQQFVARDNVVMDVLGRYCENV